MDISPQRDILRRFYGLDYLHIDSDWTREPDFIGKEIVTHYGIFSPDRTYTKERKFDAPRAEWMKNGRRHVVYVPVVAKRVHKGGFLWESHTYERDDKAMLESLRGYIEQSLTETQEPPNER